MIAAPQHTCHHPDCDVSIPKKMWACRIHWYPLPDALRAFIWETYDADGEPTIAYLEAAMASFNFWKDQHVNELP